MKKLAQLILVLAVYHCSATDLKISKPLWYIQEGTSFAVFNVNWNNAWNNDLNNDGIWLFCKSLQNTGGFKHIKVLDTGHEIINNFSDEEVSLDFLVPNDRTGLFLFPSGKYKGTIQVTIKIMLDTSGFSEINTRKSTFKVYGIEMVNIPQGSFVLGDSDKIALNYGAFFKPDNGNFKAWIHVESEDQEFKIAKDGDLYYNTSEGYEGDQQGLIPQTYPKGVQPFYMMKYELTEIQYVDFLNSLTPAQLQQRAIDKSENYTGSIVQNGAIYESAFPDRPASFVGWDDAMAYADWAGLRPMTEFEFTKAARGPSTPGANEFPWGTDQKEFMQRLPDENGKLTMLNGWDESMLSTDTKKYFGASYYWVMDLAGSLWERIITVGHEKGRNFTGIHGDGVLSAEGAATIENWPVGDENSGGIGFRGGGFYGYDREYHEYNPFSPVSYRPYGGWHGGMRSAAYGTRFVRTLD